MNVKFQKMASYTEFSQFFWNLTIIFLGSQEKYSLVLLRITNIIIPIALAKCKKGCDIVYIILVQGFCPL